MRALSLLLRLGVGPQTVRLSFVAGPGATEAQVEAALRESARKIERRAPGVFDADLPTDRLEPFLAAHHALFRRVDAPGWLHGERIGRPNDRAEVTIAVDEPPTVERKRELQRLGFHLVGEGEGELRGVVLGRNIADLLTATWIGPVEVRKVHSPKH